MAACSKYVSRLRQALKFRGLPFPEEIIKTIGKRATSDRSLDNIIHSVCEILEPPHCQKSHCPHFTSYAFCGCSQNLVPGRCPLNLTYLKNKKEREERIINNVVSQLPVKVQEKITPEIRQTILDASKFKLVELINKWKKIKI